jgi:hypothetical protein
MTVENEVGQTICDDCFEVVAIPVPEPGSVTILTPANNVNIPQSVGSTQVDMTVSVADVTLGDGDHFLRYYVDGVEQDTVTATSYTYFDVPFGFHFLSVELLRCDGDPCNLVPVNNIGAMDVITVKIIKGVQPKRNVMTAISAPITTASVVSAPRVNAPTVFPMQAAAT